MLPCFFIFFMEFGTEKNVDDHFKSGSRFFFLGLVIGFPILSLLNNSSSFLLQVQLEEITKISGGEIQSDYYRNSQFWELEILEPTKGGYGIFLPTISI